MPGLFNDFDPMKSIGSNQYGISPKNLSKGSLISFEYKFSYGMIPNVIHDPKPMVILTDVWAPNYIRGINLHYLTFPYLKKILQNFGGNPTFSYSLIKPDQYVANAFRMYSMKGVMKPKILDTNWLKTVLQSARTFDAGELEKIRTNIQQQIQARLQIKANELTQHDQWKKQLEINQINNKVEGIQNAVQGGFTNN